MSDKLKVLIVDDAVLARKVLGDVITEEGDMEVVAAAANGKIALQRLAIAMPDVIVLDFEMPEMNGLETIDAIRQMNRSVPIVMFSALTERGARETLDALSRGANEYVTKPTAGAGVNGSKQQIREQLIPKLRALTKRDSSSKPRGPEAAVIASASEPPAVRVDAIAIGVSTGGPNALAEVIPLLPKDLPVPVLITQHMPPTFTRMLAERLAQHAQIAVREASEGDLVRSGCAYIAPGGKHMVVRSSGKEQFIALTEDAPENSCRPAVDVMLRSMVDVYGKHILSVIMTGMGQDGLEGCRKARAAGGIVLAQDEASSVVWGMPGAVSKAGVAHRVYPLSDLAHQIARFCRQHRTSAVAAAQPGGLR